VRLSLFVDIEVLSLEWSHADAETGGLESSLFIAGDIEPSFLSPSAELVGALPQPLTRMCLFKASFLEKLLSQCPQGNGLTARWMRLCLFKS